MGIRTVGQMKNYKEAPFTPEILAAVESELAINCRKVLLN